MYNLEDLESMALASISLKEIAEDFFQRRYEIDDEIKLYYSWSKPKKAVLINDIQIFSIDFSDLGNLFQVYIEYSKDRYHQYFDDDEDLDLTGVSFPLSDLTKDWDILVEDWLKNNQKIKEREERQESYLLLEKQRKEEEAAKKEYLKLKTRFEKE